MNLLQFLPSIVEAVKILRDRETRKDNAAKPSTTVAKVGAGAGLFMVIDPNTPPEVAALVLLGSAALYFYRRKTR